MEYYEYEKPNYDMLRKIITLTVEYADFGGEENFVKEEDVLAESFTEAEQKLSRYLGNRQYRVVSCCWKKHVIDSTLEKV